MVLELSMLVVLWAPSLGPEDFIAACQADDRPIGRLTTFSEGTATLATLNGPVKSQDVISLRRLATPLPPFPRGPVLLTNSGDRIPGTIKGGNADALQFRPTFVDVDWQVPLTAIDVVWLTQTPADTPPDPSRYSWLADRPRRDVVRLANGDTARGAIDGFVADQAAIRWGPETGAARSLSLADLSAIAFNPGLARARKPKGAVTRLVLRDGARISVTGLSIEGDVVRGTTLFGQLLDLRTEDVVGLDIEGGKAVPLASLKPRTVEQTGFLGLSWPPLENRSVRGEPLRLLTASGEATFDRGLGTHPRTQINYPLGGKYQRFEALVGMAPGSGGRGRAVVRILVDGKERETPGLPNLAAGPAILVRVNISGAKELALVVDFGPAGDVQADVNWADARLVE
jgi:hypothetical protein